MPAATARLEQDHYNIQGTHDACNSNVSVLESAASGSELQAQTTVYNAEHDDGTTKPYMHVAGWRLSLVPLVQNVMSPSKKWLEAHQRTSNDAELRVRLSKKLYHVRNQSAGTSLQNTRTTYNANIRSHDVANGQASPHGAKGNSLPACVDRPLAKDGH